MKSSLGNSFRYETGAEAGGDLSEGNDFRFDGKRVAALAFSNYPYDPRPRRAAESLVRQGASVEMICLQETKQEPLRETVAGVDVTRIPLSRKRGGKLSYILQYGLFILQCGLILGGRCLRRRYDLIHVHNMPDVLVFSALVPKLMGAKVILDLHDPMPELMMTIFGLQEKSLLVAVLKWLEKLSLAFADRVLTVNEAFRRLFVSRSCDPAKLKVVMNSPDEAIFPLVGLSNQVAAHDNAFIVMYHGSLVERHGLDLLVDAVSKVGLTHSTVQLRIYGQKTPFLEQVMDSVHQRDLAEQVQYFGPKSLAEIAQAIRECDLGIIPNRRSRFTELNMPTRIFEYLSQGKPVIAPRTAGIQDYFGEDDLLWFELGNADDLAVQIQYVLEHPQETSRRTRVGQKVYERHTWHAERETFIDVVRSLVAPQQVPKRSRI